MKLCWVTDIHLNFLYRPKRLEFSQKILDTQADAVVISGDIAEGPTVEIMLTEMANDIKKPIYFVLGNHDFYRDSIKEIRHSVRTRFHPLVNYLPTGVFDLSPTTKIMGIDGVADGRYGDFAGSNVMLNDYYLIEELKDFRTQGKLLEGMQYYADEDAALLRANFKDHVERKPVKQVIIATHVPPFPEACYYRGKMSGKDYLPFYSSKATGDAVLDFAKGMPDTQFLVLCGHTHGKAEYKPMDNLTVKCGASEYHHPEIAEVMEVE